MPKQDLQNDNTSGHANEEKSYEASPEDEEQQAISDS